MPWKRRLVVVCCLFAHENKTTLPFDEAKNELCTLAHVQTCTILQDYGCIPLCDAALFDSASTFAFCWANGPRNHTAQDAVTQNQRVEQHGTHVSEKGQEQEIGEYCMGFAQRGV